MSTRVAAGVPTAHPTIRIRLGEIARQRTMFPVLRQLGAVEQAAIVSAMQQRRILRV